MRVVANEDDVVFRCLELMRGEGVKQITKNVPSIMNPLLAWLRESPALFRRVRGVGLDGTVPTLPVILLVVFRRGAEVNVRLAQRKSTRKNSRRTTVVRGQRWRTNLGDVVENGYYERPRQMS